MMKTKRFFFLMVVVGLLISLFFPVIVNARIDPSARAKDILSRMTPEERVGQLFLVSFDGTDVGDKSQIYDLIVEHHIGGVVLQRDNNNFEDSPNTIGHAYNLISELQAAMWQASQESGNTSYIPLFVGISQEGGGYPKDQILSGLTSLPNEMAIGATWDPALAELVGRVAGDELSAIGFNLFFGPSLDVLENPAMSAGNGLGASVFGGDPYWVGKMGQAYISGLHEGSLGHMVVIAQHFPGLGNSDRPAEEEIATIRKSLEELRQIELVPFFAVTGNAFTPESVTDGLLVSHIRYQGFQGNIRSTTKPVSLDTQTQALNQILDLPEFLTWRENGGLLVSDNLGSEAVLRFFDPSGNNFSARLIATYAFLAGNDVMFLGDIVSSDLPDNYQTVLKVIEFFTQKYREDSAFAKRVDDSALRILIQKCRLYDDFTLANVIPRQSRLDSIGNSEDVTFHISQISATLINPTIEDLDAVLPSPPDINDTLFFLTDSRTTSQCDSCSSISLMPKNGLRDAVMNLYGPLAGGQVVSSRLKYYSFEEFQKSLDNPGSQETLENDLKISTWVIISILNSDPISGDGILLRRFLSERQDLLRNKRVILFAFDAPFYLDATDISKLTAYYGLYSKSLSFINVAARLLFQELNTVGDLPVSVPGIGYDLFSATSPDPTQVIGLSLDIPNTLPITPIPSQIFASTPVYASGDNITIKTQIIVDHNQHPVPDGTGVNFTLVQKSDGSIIQQVDTITSDGIAKAVFRIDRTGLLEIRARSEPAEKSDIIQIDIPGEGFNVTIVPLTPTIVSPTPMIVVTLTPTKNATLSINDIAHGYTGVVGWLSMLAVTVATSILAYIVGIRVASIRWGIRWCFSVLISGLVAYNYLALGFTNGVSYIQKYGLPGIIGFIFLGELIGILVAILWWWFVSAQVKRKD